MSDVTNFSLPEPEPGPGFPVHTITVTSVEYQEPVGRFLDEPEVEYEIDHGTCLYRGDDCLVDTCVLEGLHAAVFGVWDTEHRLEPKTYRVRGWTSKHDVPGEPIEYDAGIEEVDDGD